MKRFPDMAEEKFCILSVLMMLIAVSHSGTVFRPSKEDSFENEDKGPESTHLGVPDLGVNRFHDPSFPEYDGNANEIDDTISGGEPDSLVPDLDHDELPDDDYEDDGKDVDGKVDDDYGIDETAEGGIDKPLGGEDDLEESLGGKDDPEEPVLGGEEEVVDEDKIDEEDDKTSEGVDDALKDIPGFGGFFGGKETGPGFFGGGSIFDTPFFNLEQVRKYFHQMEKALEHVFKETVDEALLLNGTYANTTEEEVDINGKKYTVLKSVLRGRDNHTSIYVETLSSKSKEGGGEEAHKTKV